MEGEIIDWVYLDFQLANLNETHGHVLFNHRVNLTWFRVNFDDKFYSYATDHQMYTNVSLHFEILPLLQSISYGIHFEYEQKPGRHGDYWPPGNNTILMISPKKSIDIAGLYNQTEYYDFVLTNTSEHIPQIKRDLAVWFA